MEEGLIHFYISKKYWNIPEIKLLCTQEFHIAAYQDHIKGRQRELGFYIKGVHQTTTPHRVTCLECLKLLAPRMEKLQGKFVQRVINSYEEEISRIKERKEIG